MDAIKQGQGEHEIPNAVIGKREKNPLKSTPVTLRLLGKKTQSAQKGNPQDKCTRGYSDCNRAPKLGP